MLYDAWPDHGVPERKDYATLLNFLRLVDLTNKDISSQPHSGDLDPDPPIIVGCSAGVGRTGSFVALSSLLRVHDLIFAPCTPAVRLVHSPAQPLLPPSPLGPLPDILRQDLIAHEIDSLREQRPGMVQRKEQILLIYEALTLAFTK
jgi:protein-tyrosine phosphatase